MCRYLSGRAVPRGLSLHPHILILAHPRPVGQSPSFVFRLSSPRWYNRSGNPNRSIACATDPTVSLHRHRRPGAHEARPDPERHQQRHRRGADPRRARHRQVHRGARPGRAPARDRGGGRLPVRLRSQRPRFAVRQLPRPPGRRREAADDPPAHPLRRSAGQRDRRSRRRHPRHREGHPARRAPLRAGRAGGGQSRPALRRRGQPARRSRGRSAARFGGDGRQRGRARGDQLQPSRPASCWWAP